MMSKIMTGRLNPRQRLQELLHEAGATPTGVWLVKYVVSPLDRWLYRRTGGNWSLAGRAAGPVLLLTTRGRRTGKERTTPVFYLRGSDGEGKGDRLVVCNVNPGFEQPSPWVLNLRACPVAHVQIGRQRGVYKAREANQDEIGRYWPQLVRLWPAYQAHFERSGQRAVFILEPASIEELRSAPPAQSRQPV